MPPGATAMYKTVLAEEERLGRMNDARLWRRILGYCEGYFVALAGAVLLALLVTAATLSLPWLMQMAIDSYIVIENLAANERLAGLGKLALVYGMLVALIFGATFVQVLLLEWIGQSIMHRLRQHLFEHLLSMDLGFFYRHPAGRLVTRLTNDIQNLHEMFTAVMVSLFNDGLKLIGIFCVLLVMNARLALVMSIFLPLALLVTVFFARIAREKFRAIRSQLSRLNAFLAESLGAMTVIRSFSAEERIRDTHRELTLEYFRRNLGQIRVFGAFVPLTDLMSSLAIALIIWYGGGEVIQSRLTLGELAAFLAYMRLFFQPLRELSQKYSIVQSAMASTERIFQTIDTPPAPHEALTRSPLATEKTALSPAPSPQGGSIEFRDLSFSYEPDQPVLTDINLCIRAGETVALVGSTGAGKSTLISLLVRFYDPVQGVVLVDGQDIRDLPVHSLRQRVGLILQDIFILPDTIAANIVLDKTYDEERLQNILQQTGLRSFIERLPQGLQTRIGEGALSLSQGERQLLSFVRALYRDPDILVLDEATASIDTQTETMLEQAISVGFGNRTSLVIAHRLSTIRRADRIVVMEHGRIVEEGTHETLMASDSLYRHLVEMDQRG